MCTADYILQLDLQHKTWSTAHSHVVLKPAVVRLLTWWISQFFKNIAVLLKENNAMSLEVEYRNRLHEVVREVKKRLVSIIYSSFISCRCCLGGIGLWPFKRLKTCTVFLSIDSVKHEWKFGRTKNAVGTQATGKCFHSFVEFTETFTIVPITR